MAAFGTDTKGVVRFQRRTGSSGWRRSGGDIEEQKRLAEMGWHCITIWECELKPSKREETLKSLVFTLNKIWLDDHRVNTGAYPQLEEEGENYLKAAEEC